MADTAPHVDILYYSVDAVDGEVYLGVLVDGEYVEYITVDAGLYNVDNVFTTPLSTFPDGNWNFGYTFKNVDTIKSCFAWARHDELLSIKQQWHPTEIYYPSLTFGEKLRPNVCEVTSGWFPSPVTAKFATCVWEVKAYDHETQEERTIGFLVEKVEGRHATSEDIPRCRAELSKLYALNIIRGDVNKHNLLVPDSRVTIVDFECVQKSNDGDAMAEKLQQLEQQLLSTSQSDSRYTITP